MIMNLDFNALYHSQQVPVSLVIADFYYQNCMLNFFEYTYLMLAWTMHRAMYLGGIEGRTAKWEVFEHCLICSSV